LHRCLFLFRWVFSLSAGIAPCYISSNIVLLSSYSATNTETNGLKSLSWYPTIWALGC
jgi:hypothetical protein